MYTGTTDDTNTKAPHDDATRKERTELQESGRQYYAKTTDDTRGKHQMTGADSTRRKQQTILHQNNRRYYTKTTDDTTPKQQTILYQNNGRY